MTGVRRVPRLRTLTALAAFAAARDTDVALRATCSTSCNDCAIHGDRAQPRRPRRCWRIGCICRTREAERTHVGKPRAPGRLLNLPS